MTRLIAWAGSRRAIVIAFLLYYAIGTCGILARYEWNPTTLIRFGHYYVEQNPELTPAGAVRLIGNEDAGGNGYDGQIFYYYARTLFSPGVWPEGFSRAYRAPRAGYPVLVAPFAIFGDQGVVAGLYIVQLALLVGSLVCLHALLPPDRKILALFYAISPFAFMSYSLMVSDSVMIGLCVIGYYWYRRWDAAARPGRQALGAALCFSLAILAKESALFFLFPLGLHALWRRQWSRAALMIVVLAPAFAWQLYLRTAHGMVPAGILSIFLSPFDGIQGVIVESWRLFGEFFAEPGGGTFIALVKHGAKVLLLGVLLAACVVPFTGDLRAAFVPLRLGVLLTALHIVIADYFYFWGIFDNVGRMFTLSVPLMVLLAGEDRRCRTGVFFGLMSLLAAFVLVRSVLFTPAFPYDIYQPYRGPDYAQDAAGPGWRDRQIP